MECKQYENLKDCPWVQKVGSEELCPECRQDEIGQGMCAWSGQEDKVCPAIDELGL